MMADQIRIMVVDDHPITRAGLTLFLKAHNDLSLVGEASSGEEAVALCEKVSPDVVLMDLKLPGIDGVSAMLAIRERHPQVQVIVLTSYPDPSFVEHAVQEGAVGYLLKNVSAQELVDAIRSANHGQPVLAKEATEALVQIVRQQTTRQNDLTEREREVLALLVEGLSNAQIAERLTVSRATVKFHVGGILNKLGASSRAEVITMAWQHRLIATPTQLSPSPFKSNDSP
jgi:NarL family two-component system response regulator LiaR